MSEIVRGILRAVSSGLQIPTIIILILLILLTIVMLGSFIAEILTERKSLKMNIPKLVDELQGKTTAEMKEVVAASSLLTRQKAATQELISRVNYPEDTREALARQLIADEESRYNRIVKITDLTARVAPMFGLMGTLIPLGPGLIALGEGDAATLAESLLIAFDTTVAGLISGAVSFIVSGFRKGWYEEYMTGLETIMETILDVQNEERRKALQQRKAADAAKAGQAVSRNTVAMSKEQASQMEARAQAMQQPMQQTIQPQPAARPAAPQAMPQQPAQQPMQPQPAVRPAAPQAMPQQPAQQPTQPQPAVRPAAPQAMPQQPAQPEQPKPSITSKPTFAQATSKTVAGPAAQQLQDEIKAAEEAMHKTELEQIQSLDDLLESFSPMEGRQ